MSVRRRKKRNYVIGGVILVVLLVAFGAGCLIWNNSRNQAEETKDEEVSQTEEVKEAEQKEGETEEEYSERLAEEKKVKQYEGEDPNKSEELSGAITYAAVNNGRLTVGVNIDQFLSEGKCEMSLVRNGDVIYSDSVDIIADVTTSSCDDFNVFTSELSGGNTDIVIKLSAGGKTGTIRGEVNI